MPRLTAQRASLERGLAGLLALALHALLAVPLLTTWPLESAPAARLQAVSVQMVRLPLASVATPAVAATPPRSADMPVPLTPPVEVQEAELAVERVKPDQVLRPAPPKPKSEPKPEPKPEPKSEPKPEAVQTSALQTSLQTSDMPPGKVQQAGSPAAGAAMAAAGSGDSLSDYHPLEKQAPDYPRAALRKNLEGDCTVQYTVNPQGRVESPRVAGECHPMFVGPSLKAAQGFRYAPKRVGGVAVPVHNVKNIFQYRIK